MEPQKFYVVRCHIHSVSQHNAQRGNNEIFTGNLTERSGTNEYPVIESLNVYTSLRKANKICDFLTQEFSTKVNPFNYYSQGFLIEYLHVNGQLVQKLINVGKYKSSPRIFKTVWEIIWLSEYSTKPYVVQTINVDMKEPVDETDYTIDKRSIQV